MYLGLDLGTSSLKAVLVDGRQNVLDHASVALSVERPHPGWSEQDPASWLAAVHAAMGELRSRRGKELAAVEGIGLSGQQHGAVLLDSDDRILRPCILWDDTRAAAECGELEAAFPDLRRVSGNIAMPGFTAPKLLWVRRHEPDIFARTARVLLPKAWLRLALTGEAIEEMSDASGTSWLDVGRRDWSEAALAATGLSRRSMPRLVEGSAPAGQLRASFAEDWGLTKRPIFAGGAGDNAAGAIGLGAIRPSEAFVSLGTSGVLFATTDAFRPYPERAVHAFCHALPDLWHQMAVTLSAASSLAWWSGITGMSPGDLVAEIGTPARPSRTIFMPYLAGERTPHNDPAVRGGFLHLAHATDRAAMTQAVLEGVAFSLRDGFDAIAASGTVLAQVDAIGGGSRSRSWLAILANVLGLPLNRLADGEQGGAFGAARLARLAVTGEDPAALCTPPRRFETIVPDPALSEAYGERLAAFRRAYPLLAG
ncbi:xylulose kinase [Methylobacterium sp. Leaf456]|uniref:xylulokinase n=1 Tax=Methylobacterium sp. Leaf456 TaxID=1736382 RepID=UPI0006F76D2F|nr:xylulokinase [Methylobacterium sp. Leaf456]KQT60977.1 xylulose kinase [Methylobacterium sp. Leaf456]